MSIRSSNYSSDLFIYELHSFERRLPEVSIVKKPSYTIRKVGMNIARIKRVLDLYGLCLSELL